MVKSWMHCLVVGMIFSQDVVAVRIDDSPIVVREASGIVRLGDKLLIVGDDADGRYFELDLNGRSGPVIPIDPERVREIVLPQAEFAMDLEAIDVLADDRIVVLSEQQRCLIGRESLDSDRCTVIAEYDRTLTEFGNRGLEGLAITRDTDGDSRIAVLWEGGYPVLEDVPPQLRQRVGRFPLKPVVVVHELKGGKNLESVVKPDKYITLEVPEPAGIIPLAQRLRGTDLVWHRWHEGDENGEPAEGFIVLMSSENSPPAGSDISKRYEIKLLQRFNLEGEPVGEPLDIKKICQDILIGSEEKICKDLDQKMADHMKEIIDIVRKTGGEDVNWEGLSWFEEGKSLITIYDTWPRDPPFALVLDIPDEWK